MKPLRLLILLSGCMLVPKGTTSVSSTGAAPHAVIPPTSIAYADGKIFADLWIYDPPQDAESHLAAYLRGPGAPAAPRELRCIGSARAVSCEGLQPDDTGQLDRFWPRQGTGWQLGPDAHEGRYSIEVTFDGTVIGHADVDLVRMPSLAGETVLMPDPAKRANQLWRMPANLVAWLPTDRRFPERLVTAMWFHDGELVVHESTVLHAPPDEGPVFDARPVQIRSPGDMLRRQYKAEPAKTGQWQLVVFIDAKKLAGAWDVKLDDDAWGIAQPVKPAPAQLAAAKKLLRPDASLAHAWPENIVCALAVDKTGRTWLARKEELTKAWWGAQGAVSAGYQSEYEDAERKAAAQGREVTQAERDAAGRRGDVGARNGQGAIDMVEGANRSHWAKLENIARKYPGKCVRQLVPAADKDLVE